MEGKNGGHTENTTWGEQQTCHGSHGNKRFLTQKKPPGMEEEAYTATGMWNKERGLQPAQK